MNVLSYIVGVVGALLLFGVVFEMLRRGKLRERHALWWLIAGVLALVAALFPQLQTGLASLFGVDIPVNLFFFVSIIVLFLVSIQQATELTKLEDRTRTLAEHSALLDDRIRNLEQQLRESERQDGSGN